MPDARSSCSFQHVHRSTDLLLGSRERLANVLFRSGPELGKGVGYAISRSIQILSHHSEPRARYSWAGTNLNVGTQLPRAGALCRHCFGASTCHVHLLFVSYATELDAPLHEAEQFSLSCRWLVGCRRIMEAKPRILPTLEHLASGRPASLLMASTRSPF